MQSWRSEKKIILLTIEPVGEYREEEVEEVEGADGHRPRILAYQSVPRLMLICELAEYQ